MKKKRSLEELTLTTIALLMAAVSPIIFVVAQAGYAKLSDLAVTLLLPAFLLLSTVLIFAWRRQLSLLTNCLLAGAGAGFMATVGLEVVREIGFRLGGMPGELPQLMGVLLLDRFSLGPTLLSILAGWGYHFLNGASFGVIFTLLFSRVSWWYGLIYGVLIGIVFMASPAVVALGVGRFGVEFGWGFSFTVTLAHLAFGTILGLLAQRWVRQSSPFLFYLK